MDQLLQDIRFGWRLLRRSPGFTAATVIALALGVGATTAVFTLLDRVVLRPLPYPDADRLVMTWEANDGAGLGHERLSPVNFMDYRGLSQAFQDAAAWWYPQLTLTEPGHDPLRVNAIEASGNFFSVLGVQPALGAGFPREPLFSRDAIAVISHRLWRERFGSDPAIVGKTIALNGPLFTVVGVMPRGFQYPGDTDVWHRLTWDMTQHSRGAHFMESLFRLKRGVTIDQANAELRALTKRLGDANPSTNGAWTARAAPLAVEIVGFFRPALFALFAAAAFLLVITCTNVASLLLARATVREREVAVRAAIGASRGRLMRQFLTESVLLALIGTALGVVIAIGASRALIAASPVPIPRVDGLEVDARLLLFGGALALLTAIAFGVVPAMLMARGDVQRPLKEQGRGAGGSAARRRARGLLVVAEVGLAVMLLVGAALLARSFERLVQQDAGFSPGAAITAKVELPYSYREWPKIVDFYDRLLASIRAEAGVTLVGATNFLPLDAAWRGPYSVQGRPRPRSGDESQAQHQTVDDEYFKALGVPLVRGRFFDARDTADAPGVVLINETLARRQWPGDDPIGRSLYSSVRVIGPMGRSLLPPRATVEVVGVVADVKNSTLVRDAEPAIYFPLRQFPFRGLYVVVRGRGGPSTLIAAVRDAVRQQDPDLAISDARTLDRVVGDATDRPRSLMVLMGVFAALALTLAALGIYSVMSYGVNQRRQEISVRMALGAQRRDVLWLVVRQGLALALLGALAGAAGALALGRTLSSLLFGVSPADAIAFAIALAVALGTAVVACVVPARRAAALDPLQGLRAD
jgi:putative ABC transport system permease protein